MKKMITYLITALVIAVGGPGIAGAFDTTVKWDSNTDNPSGYYIYLSTSELTGSPVDQVAYRLKDPAGNDITVPHSADPQAVITTLTPDTTYHIRVTAFNRRGDDVAESDFSNAVTDIFTTPHDPTNCLVVTVGG